MGGVPGAGYRFFRVNVTGNSGSYIRFTSITIKEGATEYPFSINAMTSDTTPIPLVSSASSTFNYGYEPYHAFMYSYAQASNRWISGGDSPQWIQIDLGAGNEISPTSLQLCSDDVGGTGYYVTNFTFLGSNTGTFSGEQVTLYTSATLGQGDWGNYTCNLFTF